MIDAWLLFGHVIGTVVLVAGIGLEVYAVTAASRATTVARSEERRVGKECVP